MDNCVGDKPNDVDSSLKQAITRSKGHFVRNDVSASSRALLYFPPARCIDDKTKPHYASKPPESILFTALLSFSIVAPLLP